MNKKENQQIKNSSRKTITATLCFLFLLKNTYRSFLVRRVHYLHTYHSYRIQSCATLSQLRWNSHHLYQLYCLLLPKYRKCLEHLFASIPQDIQHRLQIFVQNCNDQENIFRNDFGPYCLDENLFHIIDLFQKFKNSERIEQMQLGVITKKKKIVNIH